MAQATMESSQLRLVFYSGDDLLTGKPLFKSKNFNNVKESTTPEQLYAIAQAYGALQKFSLETVERRDSIEIKAE